MRTVGMDVIRGIEGGHDSEIRELVERMRNAANENQNEERTRHTNDVANTIAEQPESDIPVIALQLAAEVSNIERINLFWR